MLLGSAATAAPAKAASSVGNADVLLAVLGPSSAHLLGPARILSAYGTVTSGFRSVTHNRRVGGMPNSYHLIGRAIDVARRPGVSHRMLDIALRRAGYVLVESLDEGDHSHFAFASIVPVRPLAPAPTIAAVAPPAPKKPLPPRVLADEHGTLIVDTPRIPAPVLAGGN